MGKELESLENERRYVAWELHEGLAQTLLQMELQIDICRKALDRGLMEMLDTEMVSLAENCSKGAREVRELVSEMRAPVGESDDLPSMLEKAAQNHHELGGPPVEIVRAAEAPPMPYEARVAAARIVQEALFNVRRHAKAGKVTVELSGTSLGIRDDGAGFDVEGVKWGGDRGGAGLMGMRLRAEAAGGALRVESTPGAGTAITFVFAAS